MSDGKLSPHPSSLRSHLSPFVFRFGNVEELSRAAANEFVRLAEEAVSAKGVFTVALSGGSTPRRLYELLADDAELFRARVPWNKIQFFFGDERLVAPDNRESNFRTAHEAMFSRAPISPEHVHRVRTEAGSEIAALEYERTLRRVFQLGEGELPRFDLVLLGLGADGHTASLFPDTPALDERERLFVANPVAQLDTVRLTLTLPTINHAAVCLFLVAGADKAETLRRVLDFEARGEQLPAQLVRPKGGKSLWFVDDAAASRLP